jgi:hypothetical protein
METKENLRKYNSTPKKPTSQWPQTQPWRCPRDCRRWAGWAWSCGRGCGSFLGAAGSEYSSRGCSRTGWWRSFPQCAVLDGHMLVKNPVCLSHKILRKLPEGGYRVWCSRCIRIWEKLNISIKNSTQTPKRIVWDDIWKKLEIY